jgi:hypothetical protein
MFIHFPSHILPQGFAHGSGDLGEINGYVVFEAVLADEVQEILEIGNLHHAIPSEGFEGIVG